MWPRAFVQGKHPLISTTSNEHTLKHWEQYNEDLRFLVKLVLLNHNNLISCP